MNNAQEASDLAEEMDRYSRNFITHELNSFDQFVELIESMTIDCFYLDWNYINLSIIDVVEKLRNSKKHRRSAIFIVTDSHQSQIPLQYSALQIDMILTKPIAKEMVAQACKKSVAKKMNQIIPEDFNVMILDNNPEIIELMTGHLEQMNHHRFKSATSIKEAKNLLMKNDFDLFLLDWNLDDGTCIDLIEFLRSNPDRTRLINSLVMVITGRDDVDDIMTLLRYNVKDHIIKPFNYDEFEEKLIYGLDRHVKTLSK